MIRYVATILLFVAVVQWSPTLAQSTILPQEKLLLNKGVIYNKENAVNITLHSNGFRLGFDRGHIKTYYKTTYYHFDIGYLRHPKEIRQSVNYQSNINISNTYVFGKQNTLYTLRGGYGVKKYLSEKALYRGIAVGFNYEMGATLGILRPYYLTFGKRVDGVTVQEQIKYTPEDAALFLNDTRILGRGDTFKGFNEVTFVPGIHGKIGGHFALGAFDQYVSALEMGLMFDLFLAEVPIMVLEDNRSLFINVYVTLQLGKRH